MKQFFASFFGTLVGLIVFVAGGVLLMFIGIAMMVSLGQQQPAVQTVESGSFLVLDLDTNITDAPPPYDGAGRLGKLFGADGERTQLRQLLDVLRTASKDDRIRGLVLTGSLRPANYGSGYACLHEIREAILAFRAKDKPVVAYAENLGTRDLYLMSAASDLVMHPFGIVWMPGLAAEPMFLAGTLEKLGVGVQVTRCGRYKSYAETYVRKDFSPEAREATQKLLDDVWSEIRREVAESRKLSPEKLQEILESPQAQFGEVAVKSGLVDRTAYWDQFLKEMKKRTGAGDDESFKQVGLRAYVKAQTESPKTGDKIAIVYAEGPIVDGEGQNENEVGGNRFARQLRKLREDSSVVGVVLRVNSPGGSASASEVIQRELRLLKESKPVVVSMGTVAASGGYWISMGADRIFAQPDTITGSIGVIGMLFNVQELARKIGVTFDVVKTGKFADTDTISRPKTEEEMRAIQGVVDWLYEAFLEKVSKGRSLEPEVVREIAEGRVWSGADAKRLGLVDEFGGLDAALADVAKRAKLGDDYEVVEFPGRRDFGEVIRDLMDDSHGDLARTGLPAAIARQLEHQMQVLGQYNDPHHVYLRMPVDIQM
jgi:protease-4